MERYLVVINHEEQYSIWPEHRDIPLGWEKEGFSGTKEECLAHIDDVWKDITPKSVRDHLEKIRENLTP